MARAGGALALIGLVLLLGRAPATAAETKPDYTISANIIAPGETVTLRLANAVAPVAWQVLDADGARIAGGEAPVEQGRAVITTPPLAAGYYRVCVAPCSGTCGDDTCALASPIAVIPRAAAVDARFGVVTHFAAGWDTSLLALARRAGIGGIRDEIPWRAVEEQEGSFSFPSSLVTYVGEAHRLDLSLLLPLTYANPLYDGGNTPYSPAGIAAYARYAGEVVNRFPASIGAAEIWNEYNGAFATGPVLENRARFYTQMLEAASARIKSVRPGLTVVGGGVAGVPLPYFRQLFEGGALGAMDVVQIHPYYDRPEDAEYDVVALGKLVGAFAGGRRKPIWATEAGAYDPQNRSMTASDLVRLNVVLLAAGVERIYWYQLRDTPDFPTNGLLETTGNAAAPYAPAPAYASYATLIRELARAKFRAREATDPRTRVYRFDGPGGPVRVAWSVGGAVDATLTAEGDLVAVAIDGRQHVLKPERGRVQITLSDAPVFIRGPLAAISEHRSDKVLTDSIRDFSEVQGAHGWSYGYRAAPGSDGAAPTGAAGAGFVAARWTHNDWSYFWADPELPFFSVGRSTMHPSLRNGAPVAAIRRWRSPVDGRALVSAEVERNADQGDGVRVELLLDGVPIAGAELGTPGHGKRQSLSLPVDLHPGSVVDLAVLPATEKLDFDTTAVRVMITMQGGGARGERRQSAALVAR